ncbi:hypothetical protein, partial [Asanoa sp. NPDC050611]|uniref:hypothetical protein n=1 Tax=Asanoa sp. NPDC050611 TaxID=3157098 RepID=UPI0033D71856
MRHPAPVVAGAYRGCRSGCLRRHDALPAGRGKHRTPLRHATFRRLWLGKTLSGFGGQFGGFAVVFY